MQLRSTRARTVGDASEAGSTTGPTAVRLRDPLLRLHCGVHTHETTPATDLYRSVPQRWSWVAFNPIAFRISASLRPGRHCDCHRGPRPAIQKTNPFSAPASRIAAIPRNPFACAFASRSASFQSLLRLTRLVSNHTSSANSALTCTPNIFVQFPVAAPPCGPPPSRLISPLEMALSKGDATHHLQHNRHMRDLTFRDASSPLVGFPLWSAHLLMLRVHQPSPLMEVHKIFGGSMVRTKTPCEACSVAQCC